MAAGTCVQTPAGWRIEYDDELLTEEERGLPQHNVLFLERESVRMIRTGGMKSDMRFLPGRKEACQYETPYGALSLSTFTEDLAVEISGQVARDMAPWVDGFYLITPFGRTGLMARIMEQMRSDGLI
jgi:hypothetical protein